MDIYVKAVKRAYIYNRQTVKIGDISEVFAPKDIMRKIKELPVLIVENDKPHYFLISIIDIIKTVNNRYPEATVNVVGETETLVHFEKHQKKVNKLWKYCKVAAVSLILLAGSSTAIMSFHTDAQIPTIFKNFYYIFFNETMENMWVIDIPYSIGLAFGILVFFNHFKRSKSEDDPTPIDVEMTVYEEDVLKTMKEKMTISDSVIGKEGSEE